MAYVWLMYHDRNYLVILMQVFFFFFFFFFFVIPGMMISWTTEHFSGFYFSYFSYIFGQLCRKKQGLHYLSFSKLFLDNLHVDIFFYSSHTRRK